MWWLATVSKHHPRNWELCKDAGLFGYSRGLAKCEEGDHLLVWHGGRGYMAYGVITGAPFVPRNRAEAPWPGGLYRFTSVVPFKVQLELPTGGIYPKFRDNVQELTGFNTAKLQHSLSAIPDEAAALVTERLLEAELGEPEEVRDAL